MTGRDLADAMPDVARALLGEPVAHLSTAKEWRYGRRGSLSIDIKRGLWRDHQTATGGGVLDLIRRERGGDVATALRWLGEGSTFVTKSIAGAHAHGCTNSNYTPKAQTGRIARGREIVPPVTRRADDDEARIASALRLWRGGHSPHGSAVAAYLADRGIDLAMLAVVAGEGIRFAPACPFGPRTRVPAMLALLTDIGTGAPVGIRRTALSAAGERARDASGAKLPHKALGRAGNAVARLGGAASPPAALALCEGVETGLSVMAATDATVWACPAGTLGKFPVLPAVERLAIYADNDPPGIEAARAVARRWRAAGRLVAIEAPARAGSDFNDLWMEMQHG